MAFIKGMINMIKDNMLLLVSVSVGVGCFRAFLKGHDFLKGHENSGLHGMTLSIATQTK